jgi:hypothetical protein
MKWKVQEVENVCAKKRRKSKKQGEDKTKKIKTATIRNKPRNVI